MRVRLLGPVDVADDAGSSVPLGGSRSGALLALLALRHPATVSGSEIIDALWGEGFPETATDTVQAWVSSLQEVIGRNEVVTVGGRGYRLGADLVVDVAEFESLVREASDRVADDPVASAGMLRKALGLWRGSALADVRDAAVLQREATRLEDLRLATLEWRIEADLLSGSTSELVAELAALVAQHPGRERLRSLQVRALHHSGRQIDALAAYDAAPTELVEDLGLEPSPGLEAVYQRILDHGEARPTSVPPGASRPDAEFPPGTMTFLMTDIVGSTALWDSRPADTARALEIIEALIEDRVRAFGGRLLKSRGEGDSTLSVFSSAASAVAAAVQVILRLESTELPNAIEMPVRSGLHSGEAQQRGGDYFGGALNRAARVRGLAQGGQILISDATAQLVEGLLDDDVTLTDLGIYALRGLARPERIHQVGHPRLQADFPPTDADDVSRNNLPSGTEVPYPAALGMFRTGHFAGRQEQMESMRAEWDLVANAGPRLVAIAGEPGIGKTRLAAELAAELHERGATVLAGRCTEDPLRPFEPFAEALHSYALTNGAADLGLKLGPLAAPLGLLVPGLAPATSLVGGGPRTDRQGAGEDRAVFLDAILSFIERLTEEAAAVLVVEDLHWATETTLVVLRSLLHAPRAIPLLIIGTYRDTELARTHPFAAALADLRGDKRVQRITLRGLDENAITECLLAQRDLDATEGLARIFLDQTGGNPFFVGELTRHLAETHADQVLPEGIREVVGRRLSSLGESGVKVLRAAAVLGPSFSFPLLEAMPAAGQDTDEVLDALDAAAAGRLIVEERLAARGEYSFAHALVRQTVYEELSTARRSRLHAQALVAIEHVHGDSPRWLSALAHHAIEAAAACDSDRMAGYVHRAAVAADERWAFEEVIDLSRRGLEVLEMGPGSPAGEARLLTTLGSGLRSTGQTEEGRLALERAMDLARRIGDGVAFARAADHSAIWEVVVGSLNEEPIALLEEALVRLGDQDPGLRVELLTDMAFAVLHGRNDFELADRYSVEAMAEAQRSNNAESYLWAAGGRDGILWGRARHADRLEISEKVQQILDESDGHGSAWGPGVLMDRARLGVELGESDARPRLESALAHLPASDAARADYWLGVLALMEGDLDLAEGYNTTGLSEARNPDQITVGLGQMFMLRREQGRLGEALDMAEVAVAETPGLASFAVALAVGRAEIGDTEEASRRLDELAARGFSNLPPDMTFPVSIFLIAELIARLDAKQHAAQLLPLLAPFGGTGIVVGYNAAVLGAADRALGQLAAVEGHLTEASGHYERAIEFEKRIGAPALVARTRYWYVRALLGGSPQQVELGLEVLAQALGTATSCGLIGLRTELESLVT